MKRRTNAMFGCVNFPVDSTEFTSTKEGGMFVKLVVVDPRDFDHSDWTIACGANVHDLENEVLVGDDRRPYPRYPEGDNRTEKDYDDFERKRRDWYEYHYPSRNDTTLSPLEGAISAPYLAAMVLGVTGWSGSNGADYWHCTVNDLTPAGRALYDAVQQQYPGCHLHLLTFLDT